MRYRDDIDPSRTWIVSDTHWGHRNIAAFCHRPDGWEDLMLENIAREVPDDAGNTLLHLGDLSYRNNAMFRAVTSKHLPQAVRKLLIMGNHDRQRPSFYKNSGFKLARPFVLRWGDWDVSFSHYPWSEKDDGEATMPENHLRLHGHIHNNGYTRTAYVPFLKNHVNLSVEQTKYKPVNLGLLLSAVIDGHYPEGEQLPDADSVEKPSHHV